MQHTEDGNYCLGFCSVWYAKRLFVEILWHCLSDVWMPFLRTNQSKASKHFGTYRIKATTRMVQLPATAAIEYVAACCRTRTRTRTRTKTKIGTITKIVRGAYARSPQVQFVNAPSRLSVPIIVAWRTNKQKKTNRQTRPPSSAGSRPPLPKFSGYGEVDAHYIFHPSTVWVRPLFTELGPKKNPFAKKANEYMSP